MNNFGVPKGGMMSPGEAATHAATEGRAISPAMGAVAVSREARNAKTPNDQAQARRAGGVDCK
jgi:hypothetical protein